MEIVFNSESFQKFEDKITRNSSKNYINREFLFICLIYGTLGAIAWAIRGTGGWGGFDGTLVPGFLWGILWYYFSYKNGIDHSKLTFFIGIGISIGGMLGYGIYVSWIQGVFLTNTGVSPYLSIDINPIWGYVWFFICGIGWLGVGGIIIGWALNTIINKRNSKKNLKIWLIRILVPFFFVCIGYLIIISFPNLIYPEYDTVFYSIENCPICIDRVISTNNTNLLFLMWWIGAIFVSIIQKDKETLVAGSVMGLGFGLFFMLTAIFTLGYVNYGSFIDWWKVWEMGSGFFGGILIAFIQRWYCIHLLKYKEILINNNDIEENIEEKRSFTKKQININIFNHFSIFIFVIILFYGSSLALGFILGFYNMDIDQYSFPPPRAIIFSFFAVISLIIFLYKIIQEKRKKENDINTLFSSKNLNLKLFLIIIFLFSIGQITIWPEKIIILYLICFIISIYSMIKLGIIKFEKEIG